MLYFLDNKKVTNWLFCGCKLQFEFSQFQFMNTSLYTILIVEDFAADRELYRRSLLTDPNYTYRLLEAESLAQGRELCQRHQFDAVLLDYALPDGDGLEFLGELAARYLNPPPVVILTGQGSESIAVRAIKLGAQDYIIKRDLTVELLQLTMQKAIENHRLRQQLQQVEDRFRMSIDNMYDCVSIFSAIRDESGQIIDFRFDYLNQAALENNRMTGDDIGKSLCEVFPAFGTSSLFEEYCDVVETGTPLIREDLVYEDMFAGERLTRSYSIRATKLDDGFVSCWRDETTKKKAELDLQAANQQIIDIWESITDAYVTIDRDWRVIYANQAATEVIFRLTNLVPAEFLGRSHWDLFPALVGGDVEREYRRALTDRVVVSLEIWFEPTASWFEVHLYPAPQGLGVYFRDISDRKREEAQLIAAQATIRQQLGEIEAIYQNAPVGLGFKDADLRFVRINERLAQINGRSVAEHIGRTVRDVLPELADRLEPLYQQIIESRQPIHDLEISGTTPAQPGIERQWLSSYYPQTDVEDRVVGVNVMVQEITDRKRLERERLEAAEERDRFFNLSIDLLAIGSFEGYFTRLNPAFEQTLGFTNAELMAQPFIDFVHPDDRAHTIAGMQHLTQGNRLVNIENRYLCQDGSYSWISWSAMPYAQTNVWYAIGHDITRRKLLDAALRESERKFSAIFEQSFELMGIVSLDGVLLEVNQTALDSIAARKEDVLGQYFWDTPWWHTEQLQQQLQDSISRAASGEFIRYEVQFPAPSGAMLITDFSLKPVFDEAGSVTTIVAEAHDITDRKQAERDLQKAEELLRTGVEVAGLGLAKFDYATNLVSLSPEAAALYGFAPDELVVTRERVHNTFHPDERAELEAIIAQVVDPAGTGWFARDHQVVWPNGEVRCLSVRKQVFFDRSGAVHRPSHAILAAIDITDRKHTERELAESEERLRTGMEVAGVGLAKFDYATNLVSLSPEAAALYGFAPDESVVTRERIHHTFHPDERAELEAIIAQVVDPLGTGWFAHDHRVVWPSGEVRYLSVRKQVFFDRVGAVGCPSHAILAAIDVTERKQTQSDLEARNQELDSFVHIVSHDLKAPLRAVANLSSWIEEDLEGSLTASTQEQMNLLRGRIERMSATIDGLLDYARIGRTEESIEPVAVADLIAETIDTLAPPTTFTIAIAQNLPTLRTKRMLLSQVFTNLLGNAIKHHDRADGMIHLGIAERPECYEFAIADDGPGIDPANHDRVFRIFQAVNPQQRTDSTGIGLAIVKKIIEAEGGTIRLESQLGEGTTFYFTWPK
jgi:PAS domain S-box-containing protein